MCHRTAYERRLLDIAPLANGCGWRVVLHAEPSATWAAQPLAAGLRCFSLRLETPACRGEGRRVPRTTGESPATPVRAPDPGWWSPRNDQTAWYCRGSPDRPGRGLSRPFRRNGGSLGVKHAIRPSNGRRCARAGPLWPVHDAVGSVGICGSLGRLRARGVIRSTFPGRDRLLCVQSGKVFVSLLDRGIGRERSAPCV